MDCVLKVQTSTLLVMSSTAARPQNAVEVRDRDAKRSALCRVDGLLTDEEATGRELDQLAGLSRVGVDGVAVGGDQIAIGRQHQSERSAQVRVILDRPVSRCPSCSCGSLRSGSRRSHCRPSRRRKACSVLAL